MTDLAQGRFGNQAALVRTPDQDRADYGEKLFPRLRAAVRSQDAANQGAIR